MFDTITPNHESTTIVLHNAKPAVDLIESEDNFFALLKTIDHALRRGVPTQDIVIAILTGTVESLVEDSQKFA